MAVSIINVFTGTSAGASSLTASGDGVSVTVPLYGNLNWLWFMVEVEDSNANKSMILFITCTSLFSWAGVSGYPPAGWQALNGPDQYSAVLTNGPLNISSSVTSGTISGSPNSVGGLGVSLPMSAANGNVLLLLSRIRGSAAASSLAGYDPTINYNAGDVALYSGNPWQARWNSQTSFCDGFTYTNKGSVAAAEATPSLTKPACFTDFWWMLQPVINNDVEYSGWTSVVSPGGGYGIFSKSSVAGNTPSALVDFGGFPYEQDVYLLEISDAPLAPASSDVVTDICERAGLLSSQIDVSLLTNANVQPNVTVPGYLIEQPRSAAEILKVLMQAFFFDGCESGGKMRWIPRGMASAISIPEADLGLLSDKAKLEESLAQAQDLPQQITVIHDDPVLDYQQNKQLKVRSVQVIGSTRQNIVLRIPMTMDADWARQVAEKALYLAWLERSGYKMNLWRAIYMMLDPTDVITFAYEGLSFTARVTENTLGQGFVVELQCVNENSSNYLSSAQGGTVQGYQGATTPQVGPTQLWLFDIPLIEDTDSNPGGTGFYFACSSQAPDWAGAVLYDSSDDSTFTDVADDANAAVYGFATTTLGSPRCPWESDNTNTLTVQFALGSPSGDTQLNVLNGTNRAIVGSELIAFQNATQNMDGTWTLSGLLRGLRGTEWACSTHSSNELVILAASGLQREAEPLSVVGVPEYYKAVTVGQDPTTAGTQEFTIGGADLKPYAPCHIGGTVDGSGNITITWLRRTRIGGEADWADGVEDVPLSEDSELYDVDVLNGSTVVRTFANVPQASVIYTAAQQTADFGSVQSSVAVNVYQKSGQVGRGYKGTGVAPTAGGWPVPIAPASGVASGSGQFYVNGS